MANNMPKTKKLPNKTEVETPYMRYHDISELNIRIAILCDEACMAINNKDYDVALKSYDLALTVAKYGLPTLLINKGVTLMRLKRLEDAIECYDAAIDAAPDKDYSIIAWHYKSMGLGKIADTQIKEVKDYVAKISEDAPASYYLKLEKMLKCYKKTVENVTVCLQNSLEINPRFKFPKECLKTCRDALKITNSLLNTVRKCKSSIKNQK